MSDTVTAKYGEQNWTDTTFENSDRKSGKDTFLRLNPGSNRIRLLTLPYLYMQHRWMPEGGKKYGYRVNCSGAHGSCPLCERGEKAKKRWFVGVIDRETDRSMVLDIGPGIYNGILGLVKDVDWGDPSTYDIDIVVNPNGSVSDYYKTIPKPKKVVASDLAKQESFNTEDLVRRSSPPTPDKVSERIEKILSEIKAESGGVSPLNTALEEDRTDENFFKNYDDKTPKRISF